MALTRPILNHKLKIGRLKEKDSKALLNQRVAKVIFSGSQEFGFQLLRKRNIVDYIELTIAGTDPPNLSTGTFNNIKVKVPIFNNEQQKIGDLLKNLDNLIAVNQRQPVLVRSQPP